MLIFQLSITWRLNEQYSHGFLIPFLCLFLILKTSYNPIIKDSKRFFLQGKIWLIVGIPLTFTLPFVWLIRGANPDWRLLNVILFIIVFILTIIPALDEAGWNKSKFYIFPISFFIVAIPWPLSYDLKLAQYFQERVASIIVDILLVLEHEVSLQGTVIDVGVFGQIGIDQACSGINGLQSSIVVSLFLGAYYKFNLINRISLLIGGILIAIGFNLLRAFSMTFIKLKGRGSLLDDPLFTIWEWNFSSLHDLAGLIETFLILLVIFGLARSAKSGFSFQTLGDAPNNWELLKTIPSPYFSLTIILSASLSIFYSIFHYGNSEKEMIPTPSLSLDLDEADVYIEELEISKQITAQLHFKEAKSIQWQDRYKNRISPYNQKISINPSQEYWQLFNASWDSGGACTAILSTHSPDSCIPLTGLTQISPKPGESAPTINLNIEGQSISFESYEFSKNYRKLFVFRCFWPHKITPGEKNIFPSGGYNFAGRINSALEGRRNVGGTMLALAIANVKSSQIATTKLIGLANHRLNFDPPEN